MVLIWSFRTISELYGEQTRLNTTYQIDRSGINTPHWNFRRGLQKTAKTTKKNSCESQKDFHVIFRVGRCVVDFGGMPHG